MTQTDVTITDHLPLPVSDGRVLSARMWRPETKGPCPVILEIHPYPHAYSTATRDEINHGYFAAHGYIALRVDTPGTGDSEGRLTDTYRPEELETIQEVLAWIEAQDWCDGNIGMFGHSWGAYNALQMAANAPSALKAVAFSGASDDLYSEDCHGRGGVMASENVGWAATLLSFLSRPPTIAGFGDARTQKWRERLNNLEWVLPTWLAHQARDAYWHGPSVCDDYARVSIPVLAASGWADTYCTSVMRMAEHLPGSFAGVIGPWAHKFPHMGMPKPGIGWLQEVVRWWDNWLRGIDTGADALPRLRCFITECARPEAHSDSERSGLWWAHETWPPNAPHQRTFHLDAGALTDHPGSGSFVVASPAAVGTAGGELMPMGWGADLPGDQRGDDGLSVTFDTASLDQDFDFLGRARIDLTITADRPVGFIVARLCDVHPDGASTRVCYGVHNLTHNADHSQVTLLEPGIPKRISFEVDAAGYRFVRGHRIRLALSSAYWPLLWPSPSPVTLQVALEDARLTLPMRDAGAKASDPFDPPEGAAPELRTQLSPASFSREVMTDQATGVTTMRITDVAAREEDTARGLVTWGETERTYRVSSDHGEALMSSTRDVNLMDGDTHLRTLTQVAFSSDQTQFHSRVSLTAWENDKVVSQREWTDTSRRNGT